MVGDLVHVCIYTLTRAHSHLHSNRHVNPYGGERNEKSIGPGHGPFYMDASSQTSNYSSYSNKGIVDFGS